MLQERSRLCYFLMLNISGSTLQNGSEQFRNFLRNREPLSVLGKEHWSKFSGTPIACHCNFSSALQSNNAIYYFKDKSKNAFLFVIWKN